MTGDTEYCLPVLAGPTSTALDPPIASSNCGAPVDISRRTTKSGWTEAARHPDMDSGIQLGQSMCQIMGKLVPTPRPRCASWRRATACTSRTRRTTCSGRSRPVAARERHVAAPGVDPDAGRPAARHAAGGGVPGTISFSQRQPRWRTTWRCPSSPAWRPSTCGSTRWCSRHPRVPSATTGTTAGVRFSTSGDGGATQSGGAGLLKMGLSMAGMDVGGRRRVVDRRRDLLAPSRRPVRRPASPSPASIPGPRPGALSRRQSPSSVTWPMMSRSWPSCRRSFFGRSVGRCCKCTSSSRRPG